MEEYPDCIQYATYNVQYKNKLVYTAKISPDSYWIWVRGYFQSRERSDLFGGVLGASAFSASFS